MRILLALAFVVVASVCAVTYRELLLANAQRPVRVPRVVIRELAQTQPTLLMPTLSTPTLSTDSLASVDTAEDGYMLLLREHGDDVGSMRDLALLYMKHGWFDQALGPLAHARTLQPENEEIRRYLELAVARSESGYVDLINAAQEFVERVAMWGEGC